MHIVFIINSLEARGGTERVASLLANHLSRFYQITILSKYFHNEENAYPLDKSVSDIKFTGNDFVFLKKCKEYVAKNDPEILIIHTMSKLTCALLISGFKAKRIWSIEHISYEFHTFLYKQLRKRLYKKVNTVITLTICDQENYKKFHTNVISIPNATPLQIKEKSSKNQSKIIVSIGRLTHQKGYDLLVDAWSKLEKNHPDWSLHIYGQGEDRENLEQMIRDYNLSNITLKGITSDVESVYDNASIYVMSSRFEGFGMVLIEAQSRGLPIVSFDCPSGPAEIIQNEVNGYLVERKNTKALSNQIKYLIKHEPIRENFSKKALISAKRFTVNNIMTQWTSLIESQNE